MPPKKATTPIKSTKVPYFSHEDTKHVKFWLSQLKKKVSEMDGSMLKKVDFLGSQENNKREMDKKVCLGSTK